MEEELFLVVSRSSNAHRHPLQLDRLSANLSTRDKFPQLTVLLLHQLYLLLKQVAIGVLPHLLGLTFKLVNVFLQLRILLFELTNSLFKFLQLIGIRSHVIQ